MKVLFLLHILLLVEREVLSKSLLTQTRSGVTQFLSNPQENYPEKNHRTKINKEDYRSNAVERPLFIGSFNVQTLGKKKLSDVTIMVTVEKIVHRYDLILILELMTNDSRLMERFLRDVNNFAPEGIHYNMTVSHDPHVNEYCAILYRVDKLTLLKSESYDDRKKFYRRPFFALFNSPTLRDMKQFGIIGLHAKPSQAVQELNALADVYDFMKIKYNIEDILLMGDFNADCTYVKEQDWEKIDLWMRTEFTWPISNNVDTTTNYRKCALDRFVYAGENMNDGIIMPSARAFDYRIEFDVLLEEVRSVSDHWPIEIKIRGKTSPVTTKHLKSDACFTIQDSRVRKIEAAKLTKAAKTVHFISTTLTSGILLRNETKNVDHMLEAIISLRSAIPDAISQEQIEAIVYKCEYGALQDASSYGDLPNESFKIEFSIVKGLSKVSICKTTTIN